MRGSKRCRKHGGKSLKGIASATYKHGLRSKYMPRNLGARFHEAMNDPALLKLDQDVGLVEAQLLEALRKFEEPGADWARARRLFAEMDAAILAGDGMAANARRAELKNLIATGCAEAHTRQELLDLIEHRRRLIDSIRKHEVQAQEILTLQQAQVLYSGLCHIVRREVQDRKVLHRISEAFVRLIGAVDRGERAMPRLLEAEAVEVE